MVRFLLFIAIACCILGGIHYYIWVRLVRDTALTGAPRVAATIAVWTLAASLPASFFIGRSLSWPGSRWVLFPIYVWMGLMLILFFLILAVDIVRAAARLLGLIAPAVRPPFDSSRRLALARLTGGGIALAGAALGVASVWEASRDIHVRDVTVRIGKLSRAMHGSTIVVLSDIHVGSLQGRRFVERVVEQVNALEPDVVAIVGDLVDGTVAQLRDAVAPIGTIRARLGVFFVTGNHEYYVSNDQLTGWGAWAEELGRLGVRVLHNEHVRIGGEQDGYDLAGVPDWSARGYGKEHAPDVPRAVQGRDRSRALVMLAHQPKAVHESARHGVDLQLSGHTHGGQIWPWRYFVRLDQPIVSGLGRFGDTQIYVTRGTGTWGPPMRLGEPAEITRVVLERA